MLRFLSIFSTCGDLDAVYLVKGHKALDMLPYVLLLLLARTIAVFFVWSFSHVYIILGTGSALERHILAFREHSFCLPIIVNDV